MSKLLIKGGKRLCGELYVQGAKNAALPILAATVLCRGKNIIHNCPNLSDVDAAIKILKHLGCKVEKENSTLIIDSENITAFDIPDTLMREMRSSIIFLASILARTGKAVLCAPGGCELGPRPIDIHITALRALGCGIEEDHGSLNCSTKGFLSGCEITLPLPSVGATENAIIAACLANGKTIIRNAAREPEITDLISFLNKWNISLTTWLKDYIFIPLQRKGITSRSVNVFIVFLVSAIWHGITLPFLIWGLSHATFNILERNLISAKVSKTIFYKIIVVLSCALLWQTFKVNGVKELSTTISNLFLFSNINYTLVIILILLVAILYMFERNWFKHYIFDIKDFKKKDIILEVLFISIMLLSLVFMNTNLGSPFHYFKY